MVEFVESLGPGAPLVINGREGSKVVYVDTNYELRTQHIDKTGRFLPSLLAPPAGPEMVAFLKEALRRELPRADEMRLFERGEDGFFLCAVQFQSRPPGHHN